MPQRNRLPDQGPPPVWPDAPRRCPDLRLPRYRFVPGTGPHPTRDLEGHSFGKETSGLDEGVDLYHAGYLWEAHEAWEGVWKASGDPVEREFLQGLIQMAACLLKTHMGNARGAKILADAALGRLQGAGESCMGIEVPPIIAALEAFMASGGNWELAPQVGP